MAQEALLFLSTLLFGAAAVRDRDSRARLVLVAGFIKTLFQIVNLSGSIVRRASGIF